MTQINQNSYGSQDNKIWRCPNCETLNTAKKCITCGYEKTDDSDNNEKTPDNKKKCPKCGTFNESNANFCCKCAHPFNGSRKPVKWIVIAGLVLVALIFLMGRDNHTHSWAAATCTAPQTCTICGETTGEKANHNWKAETCTAPKTCKTCGATTGNALGHEWKNATCTEPKTCRTCGETYGTAAGHKWKEATYDAPKTCTVCKKTEGTKKDKPVETQPATEKETLSYFNEKVKIKNCNVWAKVIERELKECKQMTVTMSVEMNYGAKCKDWQIWVRSGGSFVVAADICLPNGDGSTTETIKFDTPISFDAITIVPTVPGSYSWSMGFNVTDIDCQ